MKARSLWYGGKSPPIYGGRGIVLQVCKRGSHRGKRVLRSLSLVVMIPGRKLVLALRIAVRCKFKWVQLASLTWALGTFFHYVSYNYLKEAPIARKGRSGWYAKRLES